MTAVLSGRVLHSHTIIGKADAASPNDALVSFRLVAQQTAPNGAAFEILMTLGTGYSAALRGDMMRARLRPGVVAYAHGECVVLRTHPRSGEAPLLLQGAHYIRGGEQPDISEPSPAVAAALRKLGRRVQPTPAAEQVPA